MRNTECSSQGIWVAEVPPTERVDDDDDVGLTY